MNKASPRSTLRETFLKGPGTLGRDPYRLFLENTVDVVVHVDANFNRTYISGSCYETLGYQPEELLAKNGFDLVHQDDLLEVRSSLGCLGSDHEQAQTVFRMRRKDGAYIWMEGRYRYFPRDGGVVGVLRDVTKRKEAEANLAEAGKRLEAVNLMFNVTLEHISQGVCFFDGSQRLVLCNPRFATLYDLDPALTQPGTTLEAIVKRRYEVGSCPDMPADDYIAWRLKVHASMESRESELRLRNGKIMRIRHHQLVGGGWVGTHEDITESTRVADMLHQAQKLEAVGRLTGGIAHDFNNLLQTVGTALEMTALGEHLDTDQRLADLVADAQLAVKHGGQLTQQLLTFSRKQVLRPSQVNVVDLIDAMRGLLRQACGDSIILNFVWEAGPFPCLLDISQFQSAMLNLVINARDAMPSGGSLTIAVETAIIKGVDAAAAGISDGAYIKLSFIDVGQGIAPDDLPRVFEPFFTTKKFGDGNGLGLAQVYGFARQAGGSVVITSAPGKGTTVLLVLPMATSGPALQDQYR